jgi:hypothetical protein
MERQNETFFRKRIFTEGFTMAYLDCYLHHYSLTNKIYMIYNEFRKQLRLRFKRKINQPLSYGKLLYSKGYLNGIIRFGFLNKA